MQQSQKTKSEVSDDIMEITQSEMIEVQKSIKASAKISSKNSVAQSTLLNKPHLVDSKAAQKKIIGKRARLARSKSRGRV